MQKRVGFRRDIKAAWFDAAAALRTETADVDAMRVRLDDALATEIAGPENRAITVQILLRIWAKPDPGYAALHRDAVERFAAVERPEDRVWLHYGLCLLAYPFFRDAVDAAGTILDRAGTLSNAELKRRIVAEVGPLGSLANASKAVMYALRQWAALEPVDGRGTYRAGHCLVTADSTLESWLLACALSAHEADAVLANDLFRWRALFPFHFSLTPRELSRRPDLEVTRLGGQVDLISPLKIS